MAVVITHNKVATLPDEPGAEVNKAEWNAAHTIDGLGTGTPDGTKFLRDDFSWQTPGGRILVTQTVDFGSARTSLGDFTITDAAFGGLTYADAFIMASDSTPDNNALVHEMAGTLMRLTCEGPSGNDIVVHARAIAGTITGTMKIRVSVQ